MARAWAAACWSTWLAACSSRSAGTKRPARLRRWAASFAGKTAATCRTCTRCCSTITAPRSMSVWAWAPKRPNWRASWGRKAFWTPPGVNSGTRRNWAWIPRPALYTPPIYSSSGFAAKRRAQSVQQWQAEHTVTPGREPLMDDTVYKGNDWDDVRPHLWNFFRAAKSRKPVAEDAVFGNHAAIACHMANESYFRKKPVFWDEAARRITD